jgi:hypothetical protein
MRLAIGLSVLILSLAVFRLVAQAPKPPAPVAPPHVVSGPQPPRPQAPPRQVMYHQDFEGYGETAQDAQRHALDQARDWMADNVPLGWAPDKDHAEVMRERGYVTFEEPKQIDLPHSGPMKVVKAHLDITQMQAAQIQEQALKQRSQERSGILARVLVGLVALLLVAGGYLRLEEATRGYYTTALRVTAIGLLVLVVLGMMVIA